MLNVVLRQNSISLFELLLTSTDLPLLRCCQSILLAVSHTSPVNLLIVHSSTYMLAAAAGNSQSTNLILMIDARDYFAQAARLSSSMMQATNFWPFNDLSGIRWLNPPRMGCIFQKR